MQRPMPRHFLAGLCLAGGVLVATALVWWLLTQSPWGRFAEQGHWLTTHVWGQIALLDLYSGFLLALALIWLLEPSLRVRILITVLLPTLGNPVLAVWLVIRWRRLVKMACHRDFD